MMVRNLLAVLACTGVVAACQSQKAPEHENQGAAQMTEAHRGEVASEMGVLGRLSVAEKVDQVQVGDLFYTADWLNARNAPIISPSTVLGALPQNTKVQIMDLRRGANDSFVLVKVVDAESNLNGEVVFVSSRYIFDTPVDLNAIVDNGGTGTGTGTGSSGAAGSGMAGTGTSATGAAATEPQGQRPPQYIAISFDGSKSIEMWKATRQLAKSTNSKITYFISGVYFLKDANRRVYDAPKHGIGKSAIGWGGDDEEMRARVEQMNLAYGEGQEIGSHANGHFDGSSWSQSDWQSEFRQFDDLIFGVLNNNSLGRGNPFRFGPDQVRGFRAPQLGISNGLWPVMAARQFTFDASRVGSPAQWPRLRNGVWDFPLAQLRLAGSRKRTLSMDYNHYVAHSGAKPDAANSSRYELETYETYMEYFRTNYNGNRAPIHIGHHFSRWNGGAYWRALERFAKDVCSQPEVKCVTYSELVDYMSSQTPSQILAYERGGFPAMDRPFRFNGQLARTQLLSEVQESVFAREGLDTADAIRSGSRMVWEVDGKRVGNASNVDLNQYLDRQGAPAARVSFVVHDASGKQELFRSNHIYKRLDNGRLSIVPADEDGLALMVDPSAAHIEEGHEDEEDHSGAMGTETDR